LGEVVGGNLAIWHGEFGPGFEQIGNGLYLTSAGVVAVADAPLSLVGDIITFPAAYARSKDYPWARWWGEKSIPEAETVPAPQPDASDKKTDSGVESSD
jgi:hypothetical protein